MKPLKSLSDIGETRRFSYYKSQEKVFWSPRWFSLNKTHPGGVEGVQKNFPIYRKPDDFLHDHSVFRTSESWILDYLPCIEDPLEIPCSVDRNKLFSVLKKTSLYRIPL